jgi:DNA-binding IclR family transcriptional regulator
MKPSTSPAVYRSLKILETLSSVSSARFKELATIDGGISHASLSRLLTDLEALGYVAKEDGGYRLLRGLSPGTPGAVGLPEAAQRVLESLSRDLDLSAGIFAPLGRTCMVIAGRNNVGEAATIGAPGTEMPQYAVHGFAKIFLAHAPAATRHEIYGALPRYVSHQKPPFDGWIAALDATAKTGCALEAMEWQAHVARFAISVSRFGSSVPDFALGVIGGPESITNREAIFTRLAAARDELGKILAGGNPAMPTSGKKSTRTRTDRAHE